MSQHNTLASTRKKIAALSIVLGLALAPMAAPGLASASTEASDNSSGFTEKSTSETSSSSSEQKDWQDQQKEWGKKERPKSDDGYTPYTPGTTTTKPAHDKEDCPEDGAYGHGGTHKDKTHHDKDYKKDHEKKHDEKPVKETVKVIKEEQPPKVVEKKVVKEVVKPAEVRQEVKQQVNQETNVMVHQKEVVAAKPQPRPVQKREVTKTVVHEQPVVAAAVPAEPAAQPPIVPAVGGKGALEETGSETTANTAAGLGILSALGALHLIRRRRKASESLTQE